VIDPGRRTTLLLGLVVAALCLGCGQKGPPLAPFILVPAPVSDLEVRRFGDEVYVGFTLPVRNQDGTEPADLVRVDVYAMTVQPRLLPDRALDLEEFEEAATLVASIEVHDPKAPPTAAPVDGIQAAPLDTRSAQGSPLTLSETLTAATLVPVDPWANEREDDDEEALGGPFIVPLMTPPTPGPLQRRYAIVSVSSKGEEAEIAERAVVSLVAAPMAPPAPTVTYTEEVANITWGLPLGVRHAVQAQTLTETVVAGATPPPAGTVPAVLRSKSIVEWPPASRYDLIEFVGSEEGLPTMPMSHNMMPLETPLYADRRVEFGVERCYGVVTLDVIGGFDVWSDLSEPTCVTFIDTFAPSAPEGLTVVGGDGVVSLIWRRNDEKDLAGYLVLRALTPGETLQALTRVPVIETTYRDTTAEPGLRYRYVVRAVDTAPLPNIGPPSNQVEEGAR
jgi:hypothetical protein